MSPIHPVRENFELWNYKYGENPVAEFASEHIVNLPTGENIDDNEIDRICSFLRKYKAEIIGCAGQWIDKLHIERLKTFLFGIKMI